jgi:predicted dehydrogenase
LLRLPRDRARAEKFAAKHGIEKFIDDYQAVVDDPGTDAIYLPLAIGMHYKWIDLALRAVRHVLCEISITGNADEAQQLAHLVESRGIVLMEALCWLYHPLTKRMKEIMACGELGHIKHIEAHLYIPVLSGKDKRFDYASGCTAKD